MGCFFACFRGRDNRHLPTTTAVSSSPPSKSNDVVVSRNRLSSLFLSEERGNTAPVEGKNFGVASQSDDKGLKDEAMFLKAHGTLERTTAEIHKASAKLKVSPSNDKNSESPRFHSWLPNTTGNKVVLDDQPFDPPTPVQCCEEWGKRTDSLEQTPLSCISTQNTQYDSLDSTKGSKTGNFHTSDRIENAVTHSPWPFVHSECPTDSSSYGGGAYKPSLYPTPLKLLDDEMQTLGTVFPRTLDNLPIVKPQVQEKISEEEGFFPMQPQNGTKPTQGLKKVSYENELQVEGSLSSWLKPTSVILDERNKRMEMTYGHIRKAPADRPIIGMVAAHWNKDEDSHVPPPKWWDGNGIPNSTNKYKEDQKVNWHATPFEERLEKALSEESSISQRKDFCVKSIACNENEENDTAISMLQSSTHPQSLVSF